MIRRKGAALAASSAQTSHGVSLRSRAFHPPGVPILLLSAELMQ
jgi:hypothetical protein